MTDLTDKLADRSARVAVLGQGYVGLAVAMGASEAGFPVVGYEPDEDRAAALTEGRSYVEDVSDQQLADALARGYTPCAEPSCLDGFDVAVISVPTPLRDRLPDLSFIQAAAAAVGPHLRRGTLVILESTTYPGTTEELVGATLTAHSPDRLVAGRDFLLAYSPERIDPGNRKHTLKTTPKIVSGIDPASLEAVAAFFGAFVDTVVPVSSTGTAELVKLIENTFRHVNIALVNELAVFANQLGVDIWEALEAAATKPFGYMPFTPGPGVGGHCLPVDPSYLSWRVKHQLGENFRFIELANEVNDHMPAYVVQRVTELLNRDRLAVNGSRTLVLGLAYKPGTRDLRESPALDVARRLVELGAQVSTFDPHLAGETVSGLDDAVTNLAELTADEVERSDVVVVVTDHDEVDWELIAAHAPRIFDARSRLDPTLPNVERL